MNEEDNLFVVCDKKSCQETAVHELCRAKCKCPFHVSCQCLFGCFVKLNSARWTYLSRISFASFNVYVQKFLMFLDCLLVLYFHCSSSHNCCFCSFLQRGGYKVVIVITVVFVIFVVIVIVFVIAFTVVLVAQTFPHLTIVAFVLFHKRG